MSCSFSAQCPLAGKLDTPRLGSQQELQMQSAATRLQSLKSWFNIPYVRKSLIPKPPACSLLNEEPTERRPSISERRQRRKMRNEASPFKNNSNADTNEIELRTPLHPSTEYSIVPSKSESGSQQSKQVDRKLAAERSHLGESPSALAVEGSVPTRNLTQVEARARQFHDAVKFLNKDNGRPPAKKKPIVQPVVVSKGMLPECWEGPNGTVILIDKPLEWTSHQACHRLKHRLRLKKIGHAGTLDPMASGLLILVAGPATKLMEVYQAQTKRYTGMIRLGETTPSFDIETEVDEHFPWDHVTDDVIASTSEGFLGDIMQIPPIYSALQVDGERLYKKARRGESMDIPARPVNIEKLVLRRDPEEAQHIHFEVVCSKGTYVRSLARDIGTALGSGAHLIALRREAIGDFDVRNAWTVDDLLQQWKGHQDTQREARIFRSERVKEESSVEISQQVAQEEVVAP